MDKQSRELFSDHLRTLLEISEDDVKDFDLSDCVELHISELLELWQAATKQAEQNKVKSVTRFKWNESVSGTRANELLDNIASLQSQIESLQAENKSINDDSYAIHLEMEKLEVEMATQSRQIAFQGKANIDLRAEIEQLKNPWVDMDKDLLVDGQFYSFLNPNRNDFLVSGFATKTRKNRWIITDKSNLQIYSNVNDFTMFMLIPELSKPNEPPTA